MNPLLILATLILGLSIWAIDVNADRINELEVKNYNLTKKLEKADKDMEDCVMENSLLNDRIDEAVRKFS